MEIIERVFYPIGQGAFYAERHPCMNIVYDCGELWDSKKSTQLVKNSFQKNATIDILFISHFDFDHVSKLNVLKKAYKIKNVILPLVSGEQLRILDSYFQIQGYSDSQLLLKNPVSFFESSTNIIQIESGDDEPIGDDFIQGIESLQNRKVIKSGTGLSVFDWLFIPYNFNNSKLLSDIKDIFISDGIEYDRYISDIDYCIDNKKRIKNSFEKLDGGINLNSLILYSGPSKNDHNYRLYSHFQGFIPFNIIPFLCECLYTDKCGCIYTGDTNLNVVAIENIFKYYWQNVGTIQVPHHGDNYSFDMNLLEIGSYILPISYSEKNNFGHPSANLISNLYSHKSLPLYINDEYKSLYVQVIMKNT